MVPRAIWQFMDRDVTHKIYGPKRSWGPYSILWVTDRSINCHLARSAVNYLLYYTSPPKTSPIFSRNKDSKTRGEIWYSWVNTFSYFLNPHAINVLLYRMKPRKHIQVKYCWQTYFKSIRRLSQTVRPR